jgi:hypothetical protein
MRLEFYRILCRLKTLFFEIVFACAEGRAIIAARIPTLAAIADA